MAGWVMHQVQDPPPLGSSWAHLAPPTQRSLSTERVMPGVKESQAWVTGVQNPCRSVGLWCHPHTSSLQVLSPAAIALGWQVGTLPLRWQSRVIGQTSEMQEISGAHLCIPSTLTARRSWPVLRAVLEPRARLSVSEKQWQPPGDLR